MKLKKTKIALISVTLLCLLLSCTYTQATTTVSNVEHPVEVKIGKSFTVVIEFEFEWDRDALYGDYIWLYYSCGLSPYIDVEGTQFIAKTISTPTPESVSIEVDTSNITCEVGDIFRFRIKYRIGQLQDDDMLGKMASTDISVYDMDEDAWSGDYDVLIIDNPRLTRTGASFVGLIIPIFAIATVIFLRRRRGY